MVHLAFIAAQIVELQYYDFTLGNNPVTFGLGRLHRRKKGTPMRKTLIGLSMSAVVILGISGASAQDRMGGDEPNGKKQMRQGEERRDANPRQQRGEAGPGQSSPSQNEMEKKAPRKEAHEPRDTGSDERIRPRDAQGDPDARRSPEMKRAAQDKKEERRDKGEMHEMKKDVVKDAAPRHDKDVVKSEDRRGTDVRADETIATKDRFAPRPRLDVKQQTRLRDTLRMGRVERIRDVDFNVRVGRTVPARYHFNPLPAAIAEIVPQYRDYDYIDADNEIIITEPRTHRIVYTLPDEGDEGMTEPRCR